jgi:purine nucleosidase
VTATPRPVIIDCDPGTDDAVALWLALGSPAAIDVRLVTVAGGNVGLGATLRNACAVVGLSGRAVPVVAGAERPLLGRFEDAAHVHGADGLGGIGLPPGPPPAPGIAADAIRASLRAAAPASVTLVGLGPATNLALALATEPALADRVAEIVLMTGAWGEGNITPSAEFNAYNDPEALAVLLACQRPVTLATLDLTSQALCTPARIAALRAGGAGACRDATVAIWRGVPPSRRSGGQGHEQHDPCAIAWLAAPELFTGRPAYATVDLCPGPDRGRTVIDRWGRLGREANVTLLETVDVDGFFVLAGRALGALP